MLVAVMLAGGASGIRAAQPSDHSPPSGQAPATRSPAKAATKPPPGPARQAGRTGAAKAKPWSIEDALPERSGALNGSAPATDKFGRIPLQSGTVGFETKSQVNPYETPDGRRIPGLDATTHNPPSYLGLSLSVPSSDKQFSFPLPSSLPSSPRFGEPQ
jgi:hypothetical protein